MELTTLSFIDIFILFTVMQLTAISFFLIVRGLSGKRELVFLGLAFFALAVNLGGSFVFRHAFFFYYRVVHLFLTGAPFAFLYAPFFYLYIRQVLRPGRLAPVRILLHCLPFLWFAGYLSLNFYFRSEAMKQQMLMDGSVISPQNAAVITVMLQAQVLCYVILVLRRLSLFRKKLKSHFSSIEKSDAAWVTRLLVGLVPLWIIDLIRFIGGFVDADVTATAETLLYIAIAVFSYYVLFNALRQPRVVFTQDAGDEPEHRKNLSGRTTSEYAARLSAVMEKERPFLEPELSLAELSRISGIPARSLSEVIRSQGMDNFYDFINEYRVREFIDLAGQPEMAGRNVLELMFEAGFNSKSVFNKVFKKKTGRNPRSFIQRQ